MAAATFAQYPADSGHLVACASAGKLASAQLTLPDDVLDILNGIDKR
jgi:hypothetical protein